jgi:hypothetical protein
MRHGGLHGAMRSGASERSLGAAESVETNSRTHNAAALPSSRESARACQNDVPHNAGEKCVHTDACLTSRVVLIQTFFEETADCHQQQMSAVTSPCRKPRRKKCSAKALPLPGIEPGIFGSVDRRLIHWATRAHVLTLWLEKYI